MNLPDDYKTGNSGTDFLIAKALEKERLLRSSNKKIVLDTINYKITPRNKYNVAAKENRTYSDGFVFASKNEMIRWDYLLKLQLAGEIKNLQRQVPFVLQEGFISKQYGEVKPILYVSDFTYINVSYRKEYKDKLIVEDSKGGVRTPEYKLKRRMFLYKFAELPFFEV